MRVPRSEALLSRQEVVAERVALLAPPGVRTVQLWLKHAFGLNGLVGALLQEAGYVEPRSVEPEVVALARDPLMTLPVS